MHLSDVGGHGRALDMSDFIILEEVRGRVETFGHHGWSPTPMVIRKDEVKSVLSPLQYDPDKDKFGAWVETMDGGSYGVKETVEEIAEKLGAK